MAITDDDLHRIPLSVCPCCGSPNNGCSSPMGGRGPRPGDVTVCLLCSTVLVFADDMTTREPTKKEAREIAGDKNVLAVVAATAKVRGEIPQ
jgi:hypothetical protein